MRLYHFHGTVEAVDYSIEILRAQGHYVVAKFKVDGVRHKLVGDRVYPNDGGSFRYPVVAGQEIYTAGPKVCGRIQVYTAYIPARQSTLYSVDDDFSKAAMFGGASFFVMAALLVLTGLSLPDIHTRYFAFFVALMPVGVGILLEIIGINIRKSRAWIDRIKGDHA